MKTTPKEWGGIVILMVIGAAVMAGILALTGSRVGFGRLFVWAIVALITITVSMTTTLVVVARFSEARGSVGESSIIIGWLLGTFVVTPLALLLVFEMLLRNLL